MSRKDEVKKMVSIPMYFYNVIIPQLGSYYSDYTVDFDVRPVACCPLHDEDTPSMRYYEETNSFYCFGCRKGGDVIQLHREFMYKQQGALPSLDEAVNFLYEYFIKGNENAKILKQTPRLVPLVQVSTPVDTARYSMYVTNLNKQLMSDGSLSRGIKQKIWSAMDNMEVLIEKNKVNALDAMDYIKQIVRESVV